MFIFTGCQVALLPSATKLRRLCFYTCLSFCSQGGLPLCMLGYHPPAADPPTPGPGTCWEETPQTRHPPPPPGADTPPDQAPPRPGITQGADTAREQTPPGRWLLLRTVRILLECILVLKSILNCFTMQYFPVPSHKR